MKDSVKTGQYVNGVYTSKNGYSGLGCLCQPGVRVYDTEHIRPFFFVPNELLYPGEWFTGLNDIAAPGVLPYYAISNYGRIWQIYSGKFMKVNYRPNGYAYFCLACRKEYSPKYLQKKYTLHTMVMKTFKYFPGCENFQVDHVNTNKTENYVDIPDPVTGELISNLEWVTPQENIIRAEKLNIRGRDRITDEQAHQICQMIRDNVPISDINKIFNHVSYNAIRNIKLKLAYKKISDLYF